MCLNIGLMASNDIVDNSAFSCMLKFASASQTDRVSCFTAVTPKNHIQNLNRRF